MSIKFSLGLSLRTSTFFNGVLGHLLERQMRIRVTIFFTAFLVFGLNSEIGKCTFLK